MDAKRRNLVLDELAVVKRDLESEAAQMRAELESVYDREEPLHAMMLDFAVAGAFSDVGVVEGERGSRESSNWELRVRKLLREARPQPSG